MGKAQLLQVQEMQQLSGRMQEDRQNPKIQTAQIPIRKIISVYL